VQALGLVVSALRRADGGPRVVVEDPYLPEHRQILEYAGADVVPIPVDGLGIMDAAVAAARPDVVLLTPAHQCPTGVLLAAGRRRALVSWAEAGGGLLVEDDYDAEYRYDRLPVAALQGLAPGAVAYLGSTSKTLAPGLRLGWLVVPEDHLEAFVQAKRCADAGSPVLEQAALARMVASGSYERHVRAARRRQRLRRAALVQAVARYLPDARVGGIAAGLHALIHLPAPVDAEALVLAARERSVGIYPLSQWRADPPPETSAVVLGYGALHPDAITVGIERMAEALRAVR
jgi:GntR family transcriptional regulator/MocR family aminotransferase